MATADFQRSAIRDAAGPERGRRVEILTVCKFGSYGFGPATSPRSTRFWHAGCFIQSRRDDEDDRYGEIFS
jgi:hypothetical protein